MASTTAITTSLLRALFISAALLNRSQTHCQQQQQQQQQLAGGGGEDEGLGDAVWPPQQQHQAPEDSFGRGSSKEELEKLLLRKRIPLPTVAGQQGDSAASAATAAVTEQIRMGDTYSNPSLLFFPATAARLREMLHSEKQALLYRRTPSPPSPSPPPPPPPPRTPPPPPPLREMVKRSQGSSSAEEQLISWPLASPLKDSNDDGGMSDYSPSNNKSSTPSSAAAAANWQWCLLTLDGNASIIQMRRDDFIRYLRMNVASLVGSDYDSVLFNSVSFTPDILVNISLNWHGRSKRIVSTLSALAEHNDTLLDLSNVHFNLTHFTPWSAIMAPKPVEGPSQVSPREVQEMVYMSVGAAIAFLLVASIIFALCQCITKSPSNRHQSKMVRSEESNGNLLANSSQYSLEQDEQQSSNPRIIYSQSFSEGLPQQQQQQQQRQRQQQRRSSHYRTLDENLAPLATFEGEDFVPRFVHQHPRNHRSDSCHSELRFLQHHQNCDSQSDIISPRTETDYSMLEYDCGGGGGTQRQMRRPCSSQSHHHHNRQHRLSRGGYLPMGPVFQTVTVDTSQLRQPSLPTSSSRPSSRMTNGSSSMSGSQSFQGVPRGATAASQQPMSSFKPLPLPLPPPDPLTPEEIERDVRIVLHNLGLDEGH